ncbi:CRISPR-associated protein, CT1132 family [Clostridium aceticum]|uniref:CRISPR-associated protein, CT1132 family n=1 Tax=Clostridium aceticum TaxID=84022 RepID=A0A0D8ID55_9CLOT|nr:CRISPR-associated protein [Clostridium aceticum]AKL94553.1 CRISPR-associated protein, CT1132 family [Clostridium aceticum]KJF28245.1 CRISPR-associated protein [Clostridium aceticum]
MTINQNSDFLFGFQATLTNPNGDPDQENKPRMDYETNTLLVSDARRKRDIRDFLKKKGQQIFVDTIADTKVTMDTMFQYIKDSYLEDEKKIKALFSKNEVLQEKWKHFFGETDDYKNTYLEKEKVSKSRKEEKDAIKQFNNLFITEIIKDALIDIRLFGSAMAVDGISKTFTGPVQLTWGYSLHPVELLKSNTIVTIMNDDSSTFGKKPKVYYSLVAHYGTINKYSGKQTGMTLKDRDIFRKSLVQGMMTNQTDSKQGQEPVFYLEIVYKPQFDGYLGDLRRFIETTWKKNKSIRSLEDVTVDFSPLTKTIEEIKDKGYIEKVIGWIHPYIPESRLLNFPEYEEVDLWAPIDMEE